MTYTLPHQLSASELANRQEDINDVKQQYKYGDTFRSPDAVPFSETFIPMIDRAGGPTFNFLDDFDDLVVELAYNVFINTFSWTRRNNVRVRHDTTGDLAALEDQLADDPSFENISLYYQQLSSMVTSDGTNDDVSEYFNIYQNWSKANVKGLDNSLYSDELFAIQAVAGPVPTVIKKVNVSDLLELQNTGFTVTDDIFLDASPFTLNGDTSLLQIATEGRLYIQDFSMLSVINGANPGDESDEKRFVFSPLALYAVTVGVEPKLLPIAIQMRQNDRNLTDWDPVFVPHIPNSFDPNLNTDNADYSWEVAKACVSSSAQIYHEIWEHLGGAHLMSEAVVMASHRRLSENHPLFALLKPHFEGTLAINDFARDTLINDGGFLDQYISCAIADFREFAMGSVSEIEHLSRIPAIDLANREVEGLPYYPYRDDAVLMWDAIHSYVEEFLNVFYLTQADFDDDMNTDIGGELGRWWTELTTDLFKNGIVLKALKLGTMESLDDLVTVATYIIFNASARHAAVNFPQGEYYSNPALCPATVSRPTPVPGNTNKDYYLEFLPPEYQAVIQLNQMMLLSSLYYTVLGNFENDAFSDSRVDVAISNFQTALSQVGDVIDLRNASLPDDLKYMHLHPNKIPQSINI